MNESTLEMTEPTAIPGRFADRVKAMKPLKVGDLPSFWRAIQPLLGALNNATETGFSAATVLSLVTEHTDTMVTAVAIASGISEDELREADLADMVDVMSAVMVANQKFTDSLQRQLKVSLARANSTRGASKH